MRWWLPTFGAFLLAASATAQSDAPSTQPSWRNPAADPVRGAVLARVCLACHGANAPQADPVAPLLRHQRQSYLFFALQAYRDGERRSDIMTPFASNLSDADMRDLAAYLAGDMLDSPPRALTDMTAYARTSADCGWCHGETGIGEFEGMPVLTGQNPAYLRQALAQYRDGTRTNATMAAVARGLDPAEDPGLADYYSAHSWLEAAQ